MATLLAQNSTNIGVPFRGIGPLGLENDIAGFGAKFIFANFLSATIGIITLVGFIWFIVIFFTGAIGIIASGGDKAKFAEARTKLTTGLIGLIVLIAGVFLVQLVGDLLGLGNILDIVAAINRLIP